MRTSVWILATLSLVACDTVTPDETTDTDVSLDGNPNGPQPLEVEGCAETYVIPGPFGELLTDAVDPHEEVYGTVEAVAEDAADGEVGPTPKHVHLGFPGRDTSNSVSFVWSTDAGTKASLVEISEGTSLGDDATRYYGVSYRYGGTSGDRYRVHELKLCGRMKPGTTYTYRVGGEQDWSKAYTFTTPPAPGTFDSFTAIIAGDSRGSYEDWGELLSAAKAEDPDIFLFSGDMVDIGGRQEEWFAWWEASDDMFAETFLVPAHGNHEFLAANYFATFSLPGNEQWFALDYGNLTLVSLNDTVPAGSGHEEFEQVRFMEEVFGSSTADWKAAMHHRATYSTCTNHGSALELRGFWEGTFDAEELDFVFAGHNHIYERSHPLRNGEVQAVGEGTVYLVSGGAGAPLYRGYESEDYSVMADPSMHYIVATFDSTGVEMVVKELTTGREIDRFSVPLPE